MRLGTIEFKVTVLHKSDNHFARCNGKAASCTASPEGAVMAVVKKCIVGTRLVFANLRAELVRSTPGRSEWFVRSNAPAKKGKVVCA